MKALKLHEHVRPTKAAAATAVTVSEAISSRRHAIGDDCFAKNVGIEELRYIREVRQTSQG